MEMEWFDFVKLMVGVIFDLILFFRENNEGFVGILEYDINLFVVIIIK